MPPRKDKLSPLQTQALALMHTGLTLHHVLRDSNSLEKKAAPCYIREDNVLHIVRHDIFSKLVQNSFVTRARDINACHHTYRLSPKGEEGLERERCIARNKDDE